jgi:hypothetical protein
LGCVDVVAEVLRRAGVEDRRALVVLRRRVVLRPVVDLRAVVLRLVLVAFEAAAVLLLVVAIWITPLP